MSVFITFIEICVLFSCSRGAPTSEDAALGLSLVNFIGCNGQLCIHAATTNQWPLRAALKLPIKHWHEFDINLHADEDEAEILKLHFALKHVIENIGSAVVTVEPHDVPDYIDVPDPPEQGGDPITLTLPLEEWISLSVHVEHYKRVLTLSLQSSSLHKSTVIKIPTVTLPQLMHASVSCKDSDVLVDLQCLQGTSENSHSSPNSLESPITRQSIITSSTVTKKRPAAPSANVIWTVTTCILLLVLLMLVFILWQRQRRLLRQGRYAHQQKIMRRQHELERRFSSDQMSSEGDLGVDESCMSTLQTSISSPEVNVNHPKPRTFVKPEKSIISKDSRSLVVTKKNHLSPESSSNESKVFHSSKSNLSNGSNESITINDENGVTGPYWFYSSRKNENNSCLLNNKN